MITCAFHGSALPEIVERLERSAAADHAVAEYAVAISPAGRSVRARLTVQPGLTTISPEEALIRGQFSYGLNEAPIDPKSLHSALRYKRLEEGHLRWPRIAAGQFHQVDVGDSRRQP
jgi:hypothetical protein